MREIPEYQCISEWQMGDDFSDEDWKYAYRTKRYSAQGAAEDYAEHEEFTDEEYVVVRNKATGEITRWRVELETVFTAYRDNSRPIGGASR